MIHMKISSPSHLLEHRKRQSNSGRNTIEKPQTIRLNERTIVSKASNDVEETNTLGFFELLEQEKAQAEMKKMLAKKKLHPIAPDALIPNSTIRSMLKVKKYEPVQMKMFQLRLDILDNLQNKTNRNLNWQNEDDEWIEMADPDGSFAESTSKPSSAKKSRNVRPTTSTLVSRQKFNYDLAWNKDTMPDIFKRLKNEPWWRETDEELNSNLRSMLLQLFDIIRDKETDSYESACNYLVDIFRTFGIEPTLVNQILDILMDHLVLSENDPLDVHTVRTIAQFMIERKNIIINLLTFTSKYSPDNILRHEAINAIKFITDVNHTEDIELVLQNIPIVRDTAEDTFSLKTIIERIKSKQSKKAPSDLNKEGEDDETESLHPLLKKISEERWFPRDITTITLDSILQAILTKLPNASKTLLKTLTTHLLQLNRVLGFSDEQFTKVAHSLISLLSHTDADYRLIAATILAELGRETKAIDIALLQSFLNDSRILVRTESCDTLKKLTGIHSDTVLKDCADDLAYLETLPEEDFTLQNYLKAKNRLPAPSLPPEQPIISSEDTGEQEQQTQVHEEQNDNNLDQPDLNLQDQTSPVFNNNENFSPSLTPHYDQQLSTDVYQQDFLQPTPNNLSITPSLMSSVTFGDQPIRVEISEKTKPFIALPSDVPQSRKETPPRAPPPSSFSQSYRPRKSRSQPPTEVNNRTPIKITVSDQTTGKRSVLLPNNSEMWDSYGKQNESPDENSSHFYNSSEVLHDTIPDPIQNILDDHKRSLGYFRSMPNRRVLIPHKVSFDDVLAEQSHLTVDRKTPYRSTSQLTSTMQLSDLNRNKRHLHEVEFVQLLTSLVIRSVQIHKHHDRFIPGSFLNSNDFYWNFTNSLSISQMQLHSPLNVDQGSFYNSSYFPPVFKERSVADDITRMKSDAQAKAKRTGINLRKAKDMEDVLSHLLKSTRDRTRSTINPSNSPHPPPYISLSDPNEITHAWLLDQLLKSQGASESEHYIQQIIRAHPKFAPLLHSRIPEGLISIIWNDPVLKHLATIISNKTDHSTVDEPTNKSTITKTSVPQFDEEHSSNFFDYAASSYLLNIQQQKEEQKKKFLPQIRGTKMRLPRHVVKFGFRELEDEPPETSLDSLRDENTSKTRRRRIYMHLMCNHYHSCL